MAAFPTSPNQFSNPAAFSNAPAGAAGARERKGMVAVPFHRCPRATVIRAEVGALRSDGRPRGFRAGQMRDGGTKSAEPGHGGPREAAIDGERGVVHGLSFLAVVPAGHHAVARIAERDRED